MSLAFSVFVALALLFFVFLCRCEIRPTFRCSFRQLLSINALQTDGSSAVSV